MNLFMRILTFGAILIALATSNPSFADVPLEPNVNDQSLFYDFVLMAETGGEFTALGNAPSINRSGTVAFQAQNLLGQGVWSFNGLFTTDLTPGFHTASRAFGRAVMLSDAGDAIASDRVSGSPPPTFVRIWPGIGSGLYTTLGAGGTGKPFDAVLSHPAVSADGSARAFTALVSGDTVTTLVTPFGQTKLEGNQGIGYRPMVANDGTIVLRDSMSGNPSLSEIVVFRGLTISRETVVNAISFGELGNQPGISDSGKIVAFAGNRGYLRGVFIAYEATPGTWTVVRVAGENASDQGNRPDLGFNLYGNPTAFSDIDVNSRVAVIHQEQGPAGLEGDTVVVSFIGTPSGESKYPRLGYYPGLFFRMAAGIWTVRVDFRLNPVTESLEARKRYAIPVVQLGDTISGTGISNFVVANLAIHDPLAEATSDDSGKALNYPAGSHRIAFWAADSADKQVILRATHVNSCLPAVRHFSQCDAPWMGLNFVIPGKTFCQKACALTSQTMAANYAADFYNITTFNTPKEVHDFILPKSGFQKGTRNINWERSIQALREVPGLLSLQPNTLRFKSRRVSVRPESSLADVASAFKYLDDQLCDVKKL